MQVYCKFNTLLLNSFMVNIEYWSPYTGHIFTYSLCFISYMGAPNELTVCLKALRINWDPAAVQTSWAQLSSNHDQMWVNRACWDSNTLREIPAVFRLSKSRLFLPHPGENRPAFSLEGDQSCVFKHHLHGTPLLLDAGLDILNNCQLILLVWEQNCSAGQIK